MASDGRTAGTPDKVPASARRVIRVIVLSAVFSKVSDYAIILIVPLTVLANTGSSSKAVLVLAMRAIAYAVSPLIGMLLDTFDRRATYVGAHLVQAISIAGVGFFSQSLWVCSTLLLISGLGAVATSLSSQFVLIPSYVSEPAERKRAVARITAALEYAKVGGLLTSGLLVALAGPAASVWFVPALFCVAASLALGLPRAPDIQREQDPVSWGVGFRWLYENRFAGLLAAMTLSNVAAGSMQSYVLVNLAERGLDVIAVSTIISVGIVLGGMSAQYSLAFFGRLPIEAQVATTYSTIFVVFFALYVNDGSVNMAVAWVATSVAFGVTNVATISYRQERIPVHLSGRVNSVMRMFIAGGVPISGALYSALDELAINVWLVGAIIQALAVVILLLTSQAIPTTRTALRREDA